MRVWQYPESADPLMEIPSEFAEDHFVAEAPHQPQPVRRVPRADPGAFSFVEDSTPPPVVTPTYPYYRLGENPPRYPRQADPGLSSLAPLAEYNDLRAWWLNATAQPTYRRRQQAGYHAEPIEPSLRVNPSPAAWQPLLAIPPRRVPASPGFTVAILDASLYRDYQLSWFRPTNPVPARRRRAVQDFHVWRWVPEATEAPILRANDNPLRPRYPTHSLTSAMSLVVGLATTPEQWTQPPSNPVVRRRRPEGLQVLASPPNLITLPLGWNRPTNPLPLPRRVIPQHPTVTLPDGWDVRPEVYLRTHDNPQVASRAMQPTHYGEFIDGLVRMPFPSVGDPPRARRHLQGGTVLVVPVMPYETFPDVWRGEFPARLDPAQRETVASFPEPFPLASWHVSPEQYGSILPMPSLRPCAETPSGLSWDLYPSWEIPLASWYRITETPPRGPSRQALWIVQQIGTGQVWDFVTDSTGRLFWRMEDPGNLWRWERTEMGLLRPVTLSKLSNWSRLYYFDFGAYAELQSGDSIASVTVTSSPSGLTVGSPSANAARVQVRIGGGQRGTVYTLTCSITLASGSVISQQGYLSVE